MDADGDAISALNLGELLRALRLLCWAMLFYAVDVEASGFDVFPDIAGAILFLRAAALTPWISIAPSSNGSFVLVQLLGAAGMIIGLVELVAGPVVRLVEVLLAVPHVLLIGRFGRVAGAMGAAGWANIWRGTAAVWATIEVGAVFYFMFVQHAMFQAILFLRFLVLVYAAWGLHRWIQRRGRFCTNCNVDIGALGGLCRICRTCRRCDYDLKGLDAPQTCPECGWRVVTAAA